MEQAANRGDNGGMLQQNELSVDNAKQNADASTDASKNSALQKITDAINQLDSDAQSQLGSYIATANQNRLSGIATQQAAEAAAAEKQYEAQLAAQARIQAAQIAHSGGSSGSSSSGGSESSQTIAEVQSALNRLGYNLDVDGVAGSDTRKAIKNYQKDTGLTVDGVIGPATLNALESNLQHQTDVMNSYSPSRETIERNITGRGPAQ